MASRARSTAGSIPHALLVQRIRRARRRLRGLVRRTPTIAASALGELVGAEVYFKLENLQETGSFKLRGALNAVLALSEDDRGRGVVAASSGNHGLAVARALELVGCPGTIYLPRNAAPHKVRALRQSPAKIVLHGNDCLEAEKRAREDAERTGKTYVSPYNDLEVIAGGGTVAAEMTEEVEPLDAVFVAVGGGGLVSGMGAWLRETWPETQVVGCSPRRSAVLYESLRAGSILDLQSEPTLSDATAGGMEEGSATFDLCRAVVDSFAIVSEEQIRRALRLMLEAEHLLVEGAAAAAVAGCLARKKSLAGKRVGIVLCGANVSAATLREVLEPARG